MGKKEGKMEKELVQGKIGEVGKYDVAFKEGKLVIEVGASVAIGEAGLSVKIGAKQVLDAIKAAIPGKIDDAIIDVLEAALIG